VSTTLYANNLPLTATEDGLVSKFAKFGGVLSVHLERDAGGGSRRSAFIEMETASGARKAIDGLNLANFDGRVVSVYAAVIPVAKSAGK
jgi:RNA recognition motif-containing protein